MFSRFFLTGISDRRNDNESQLNYFTAIFTNMHVRYLPKVLNVMLTYCNAFFIIVLNCLHFLHLLLIHYCLPCFNAISVIKVICEIPSVNKEEIFLHLMPDLIVNQVITAFVYHFVVLQLHANGKSVRIYLWSTYLAIIIVNCCVENFQYIIDLIKLFNVHS